MRSKLSGAYQLYSVAFDKFSRPIQTPVHNLRPSRDTCEKCHWPAHFSGEKMVVRDYFPGEEGEDHWRLHMLMRIGGGGGEAYSAHGSHWHVSDDVEVSYVATDHMREEIPWVRLQLADGTQKIYRDNEIDLTDDEIASREMRTMDCIDCHNRPSHHFNPPSRLINDALASGAIAADLPDIKQVLVDLMEADYRSEDEALATIAAGVSDFYTAEHPELVAARQADLDNVILRAQGLFRTNLFPEMNTSWRQFPDHIGHLHTNGCFRCHGGNHEADDGSVISRDCNLCHTIVAQELIRGAEVERVVRATYQHPVDIDEEWQTTGCAECHGE